MKGVSRTLLGESMPSVDLQPPYKAWGYLVRNELARGVGRQMYYTDEIGIENLVNTLAITALFVETRHVKALQFAGETIPLSDTDEDHDSDTEVLDGAHRQENMFILRQALGKYGVTPDAIKVAAAMLSCPQGESMVLLQGTVKSRSLHSHQKLWCIRNCPASQVS